MAPEEERDQKDKMAKSIRSKIKKYWRSQKRATYGKAHLEKQEQTIQEALQKSIEQQSTYSFYLHKGLIVLMMMMFVAGGSSILQLKAQMGSTGEPIVIEESDMNVEAPVGIISPKNASLKVQPVKKKSKRSKRFVNFYAVKKKGT